MSITIEPHNAVSYYLLAGAPGWRYPANLRIDALCAMRESGLLPEMHRRLMRARREVHAYEAQREDVFEAMMRTMDHDYWYELQRIKSASRLVQESATDAYRAMFRSDYWRARYRFDSQRDEEDDD